MPSKSPAIALLAGFMLAALSSSAAAHCCHDERSLGAAQQSQLRRGLHGMDGGLGDHDEQDEQFQQEAPPSVGGGLNHGSGSLNSGGFGQMRGNALGNYGAGSLGQRGPGGLGTLQGNSITTPPPRSR